MDAMICGIDPGLALTGYAVVHANVHPPAILDAGVCRLDAGASMPLRLATLFEDITAVLTEHCPDVVAVESLYAHYKHPRTAILMGHARGVILLAAAMRGIEVRHFPATRIKRYLTGHGRASKAQVQRAVRTTLGLESLPEPADVADALAIALCCAGEMSHDGAMEIQRR
jgi:crossover junction endodeoxyribonuclease RuvC